MRSRARRLNRNAREAVSRPESVCQAFRGDSGRLRVQLSHPIRGCHNEKFELNKWLFCLTAIALAACSSTTGIVPIGSGMSMLGVQDGWAHRKARDSYGRQDKDVEAASSRGRDYGLSVFAVR
jgi:hypothetical protein